MDKSTKHPQYSFISFLKLSVDDLFISVVEAKLRSVLKASASTNLSSTSPKTPTNYYYNQHTSTLNPRDSAFSDCESMVLNEPNHLNQLPKDFNPIGVISLTDFIKSLTTKSKVRSATLIGTLIYLDRLKMCLPATAVAVEDCSYHRIFLAALTLSGKYLNDSSPKNKHWAMYAKIYSIEQVNKMEYQFLKLINYNLKINMSDLIQEFRSFMGIYNNVIHSPPSPLLLNHCKYETSLLSPTNATNVPPTPLSGMFNSSFNLGSLNTPFHQNSALSDKTATTVTKMSQFQTPRSLLSSSSSGSTVLLNRIKNNKTHESTANTPIYKRRLLSKTNLKIENRALNYYKNHVLLQKPGHNQSKMSDQYAEPLSSAPVYYGKNASYNTFSNVRKDKTNFVNFRKPSYETEKSNGEGAVEFLQYSQKENYCSTTGIINSSANRLPPILTNNIYGDGGILYNTNINLENNK